MVPGSGAVEEAVVWQDFTQTYRFQLNHKIMLIECRYISQLHFSSTIVRDFLFLGNNKCCISILERVKFKKFSEGQARPPLTVARFAHSWHPPGFILFSKTWRL